MAEPPDRGRLRSRQPPVKAGDADGTEFFGSQVGGKSVINYSYTDMPWKLMVLDIKSFFIFAWALPWIVWPLRPCDGGHFDELSLTASNVWCVFIHLILFVLQVLFILALPLAFILPVYVFAAALAVFFSVNWLLCRCLNGSTITYTSDPEYAQALEEHRHEQWIFLNGVAVGEAWLKSNINRLALTFKRPVIGVHNRTSGIIFDVLECLIQRNFGLATKDIRLAYKIIKEKLYNPQYSKVIFILHSQGGIEGGLVLDWLLQELPQDLLAKLEVYTFGNASNHFNNPHRHVETQEATESRVRSGADDSSAPITAASLTDSPVEMKQPAPGRRSSGTTDGAPQAFSTAVADGRTEPPPPPTSPKRDLPPPPATRPASGRVIGYVEHYAHTTDFVARWGVLHFVSNERASPEMPRFIGRVFSRTSARGGHQFCQHYLDGMFPLAREGDGDGDGERNSSGEGKGNGKVKAEGKEKGKAKGTGNGKGDFVGCADANDFMDSVVELAAGGTERRDAREGFEHSWSMIERAGREYHRDGDGDGDGDGNANGNGKRGGGEGRGREDEVAVHGSFHGDRDGVADGRVRVRDLSRLWLYRNGRSPPELPPGLRPDGDGLVRGATV
ncbi:hypothetical protein GGR56DRAFT_675134 [Xylariaceae sp. FL0804]|nr:hypothetical protein GGR56DRAFT_675134 [Xylariaceae sp. FL0804]